jgi:hypothetical protein
VDGIHYGGGFKTTLSSTTFTQIYISVGKANKVKINNLKIVKDFKILGEEEFITKVKEILDL